MASLRPERDLTAGKLVENNLAVRAETVPNRRPWQIVLPQIGRVGLSFEEAYTLQAQLPARPRVEPRPEPRPEPEPEPRPASSFRGLAGGIPSGWRPYSDESPFNTPIPPNAKVDPDSAAIVANLSWSGVPRPIAAVQSDAKDYSHPRFFARTTDPLVTINAPGKPLHGFRIHCPAHARPARGNDGHLILVQPDGWEYGFGDAILGGSTVTGTWLSRQRYDGLGLITPAMINPQYPAASEFRKKGRPDFTLGGVTASYFGGDVGLIRAQHLEEGRIPHALFVVVERGARTPRDRPRAVAPGAYGAGGAGASVWPAFKGDAAGDGLLPMMGDRFRLNMTASQIRASGVPEWEQTVALAMAEFGGFMGDTGGGGFSLMAESSRNDGAEERWRRLAARYGVRHDPVYGYSFAFRGSFWRQHLQVLEPQA